LGRHEKLQYELPVTIDGYSLTVAYKKFGLRPYVEKRPDDNDDGAATAAVVCCPTRRMETRRRDAWRRIGQLSAVHSPAVLDGVKGPPLRSGPGGRPAAALDPVSAPQVLAARKAMDIPADRDAAVTISPDAQQSFG
jgi:hypothetical protein